MQERVVWVRGRGKFAQSRQLQEGLLVAVTGVYA
jgi:hypothetical protein